MKIELTCQEWILLLENSTEIEQLIDAHTFTDNSFFSQLLTEELEEFLVEKKFRSKFEDLLLDLVYKALKDDNFWDCDFFLLPDVY